MHSAQPADALRASPQSQNLQKKLLPQAQRQRFPIHIILPPLLAVAVALASWLKVEFDMEGRLQLPNIGEDLLHLIITRVCEQTPLDFMCCANTVLEA